MRPPVEFDAARQRHAARVAVLEQRRRWSGSAPRSLAVVRRWRRPARRLDATARNEKGDELRARVAAAAPPALATERA